MSESDREEIISNVSLVFHSAASVRFDMNLKEAIQTNTIGTLNMLKLAEQIQKLEGFTYVSTAYSQSNDKIIEERYYEAPIDPIKMIELVQNYDEAALNALTPKYIFLIIFELQID